MKVYISGPMTGYKDYNRMAFHKAAAQLQNAGHDPLNPADLVLYKDATWQDYMRHDIRLLTYADAILMLDGWQNSKGATTEKELADKLEIPEIDWGQIRD